MTMTLFSIFETVLRMSLSASVLILAIMILCFVLRRWLPMPVIYALSLLVFARLVIPYFPHSDYSLVPLLPRAVEMLQVETPAQTTVAPEPVVLSTELSVDGVSVSEGESSRWHYISVIWLVGLGGLIAWNLCVYWRFVRWLRLQPVGNDPELTLLMNECLRLARVEQKVSLLVVDRMRMPAVFGILRPRILLPEKMLTQLSRTELKHILLHELCHVRRGDALIGMVAAMIATLHWFNPLVWICTRQFSLVRELLCDRSVLRALPRTVDAELSYGETLLRAATLFKRQASVAPGLVPFLSNKDEIKQRLTMIVKPTSKHWLRNVAGILTGTGLAVASMTLVALPTPGDDDGKREHRDKRSEESSEREYATSERLEGRETRDERAEDYEGRRRDREHENEDRHDIYRDRVREHEDREREATEDLPKRVSREFSREKVRAQIGRLVDLGRLEEARELERKLVVEEHRREDSRAQRLESEMVRETNRKLMQHIEELSSSLSVMQEKMKKLEWKLAELSERE